MRNLQVLCIFAFVYKQKIIFNFPGYSKPALISALHSYGALLNVFLVNGALLSLEKILAAQKKSTVAPTPLEKSFRGLRLEIH